MARVKPIGPLDPVTCYPTRLPAGLLVAEGFASGEGDPNGLWLRELQGLLRRMIAGECKPTTPDWNAAITQPEGLPIVGASQLKASIPHMFLWIDYCAHVPTVCTPVSKGDGPPPNIRCRSPPPPNPKPDPNPTRRLNPSGSEGRGWWRSRWAGGRGDERDPLHPVLHRAH